MEAEEGETPWIGWLVKCLVYLLKGPGKRDPVSNKRVLEQTYKRLSSALHMHLFTDRQTHRHIDTQSNQKGELWMQLRSVLLASST